MRPPRVVTLTHSDVTRPSRATVLGRGARPGGSSRPTGRPMAPSMSPSGRRARPHPADPGAGRGADRRPRPPRARPAAGAAARRDRTAASRRLEGHRARPARHRARRHPGPARRGGLARAGGAAGLGVPGATSSTPSWPPGCTEPVHLTPEPETFCGACPPRLAVAFGRGRREPSRSPPRSTRTPSPTRAGSARALEEYRGWGWQVVLADVGDELLAAPPPRTGRAG